MELLNIIASLCSILSLILSIVTLGKVKSIHKNINDIKSPKIKAGGNMTVGGHTLVGNNSKINK